MIDRDDGQTAAEYLGVLVVIAAIVGVLADSDIGKTIRGGVQDAVCRVATGGRCETRTRRPTPSLTESAGPVGPQSAQGPEFLGDRAQLSKPRSVSYTIKTPKTGIRVTSTRSTGNRTLTASGCSLVSATKTTSFEGYGAAKGLEVAKGRRTSYQVNVGPDHAERVRRGGATPNPYDPRTLAAGESAVMTEDHYEALGLTQPIRAMRATLGDEQGRRAASSVARVDDDTMRLTIGDERFVSAKAGLGLGGAGLGMWGSREFVTGRSRSIDVDISTTDGWNAYQRFVRSGLLPNNGSAVSNPRSVVAGTGTSTMETGFDAGPVKVTSPGRSASSGVEEVTTPEGTSRTLSRRVGRVGAQVVQAKGKADRYVVQLDGSARDPGYDLRKQQGLPPGDNLQLEFTGDQLVDLRRRVQGVESTNVNQRARAALEGIQQAGDDPAEILIALSSVGGGDDDPARALFELSYGMQNQANEDGKGRRQPRPGEVDDAFKLGGRDTTPRNCPA